MHPRTGRPCQAFGRLGTLTITQGITRYTKARPFTKVFTAYRALNGSWLYVVAVAAALPSVVSLAAHLKIGLSTSHISYRTRVRWEEREAVAREIHDTLLQSAQAVLLKLDMLASDTSDTSDAALKRQLELLAKMFKGAIIEGREKVQYLRSRNSLPDDQIARIARLGMGMSDLYGIRFKEIVRGAPRALNQLASTELIPIVCELIVNAFCHSKATLITVTWSFGFWQFSITVSDDGVGIDEGILSVGASDGHWGIRGIFERATRVGAHVNFYRSHRSGTTAVVRVPARYVYFRAGTPPLSG